MNDRFDNYMNGVLHSESTILEDIQTTTIPRNSLDPVVFQYTADGPPSMQGQIATQILGDLQGLDRITAIRDFYVTGPILDYNWNEKSPIDVKIFVDPENMDDITTENVYTYIKLVNARMGTGTTHPIFYYVIQATENDPAKEKAAYDLANERWLKEPKPKYIGESIIDYAHKSLDPKLWDLSKDPISLRPDVKDEIIKHLKDYFGNKFSKYVDELHITGSIGTQQWKSDTDIDIHIVPKNIKANMAEYEEARSKIKHDFDNKGITIAGHPYEVYLQLDPEQEKRGDSSYSVLDDKWIKMPFSLSDDFDPDVEFAYLKKDLSGIFKSMDSALGELRRDLVDYDIIDDYVGHLEPAEKTFLKDKLKVKLQEIEDDMAKLIKYKTKYHGARKSGYGPEDQENAWKEVIKSKSWAPGNVMWKMLDRYKYVTLTLALQKVMREDENKKIDPSDIKDIKKVFNFKEHHQIQERAPRVHRNSKRKNRGKPTEPFKPTVGSIAQAKGKNRWKDPLAKHSMVAARGTNRQSMDQVSQSDRLDKFSRNLPYAERILDIAKDAQAGSWKLTQRQVLEIAEKYGVKVPDMENRIKKLGKTGIVLFRRSPKKLLLMKTASTVRGNVSPGKKSKAGLKKAFKMPSFKTNFRKSK